MGGDLYSDWDVLRVEAVVVEIIDCVHRFLRHLLDLLHHQTFRVVLKLLHSSEYRVAAKLANHLDKSLGPDQVSRLLSPEVSQPLLRGSDVGEEYSLDLIVGSALNHEFDWRNPKTLLMNVRRE